MTSNRDCINFTREVPQTWRLMPPTRVPGVIVGWIKRDGNADEAVVFTHGRRYAALQLGGLSLRTLPEHKVRAALTAAGVDPDSPTAADFNRTQ